MSYGNGMYGESFPSNNLWVGNNYSSGYSQMSRPNNNYQNMPLLNQNQTNQFPQVNNILRVMGPESARAFQIGPNSQVILMDSNKPIFYMKNSDSSGYSETRAFEFKEIPLNQEPTSSNNSKEEYVTKTDFEEYKKFIEDLVMKNE